MQRRLGIPRKNPAVVLQIFWIAWKPSMGSPCDQSRAHPAKRILDVGSTPKCPPPERLPTDGCAWLNTVLRLGKRMSLVRLRDDAYAIELGGVRFWMAEAGHPVPCLVTTEALFELARGLAPLNQIQIFLHFREELEAIAARKFAAERFGAFSDPRVVVYSSDLD